MSTPAEGEPRAAADVVRELFAAIEAGACCVSVDGHVLIAGVAAYYEDRRIVKCEACGAEYPAVGEPEGVEA